MQWLAKTSFQLVSNNLIPVTCIADQTFLILLKKIVLFNGYFLPLAQVSATVTFSTFLVFSQYLSHTVSYEMGG